MTGSFIAEPLIGWRTWGLRRAKSGPELIPLTGNRGSWPARAPLVAACHPYATREGSRAHRTPRLDCTCGAYATDSAESLLLAGSMPPAPVIGTVALWGRVIEHTRGYRAEFAYPDRLRLVCGPCLSGGTGPGVPTTVLELRPMSPTPMGMVPLCDEHLEQPSVGTAVAHDARAVEAALLGRYAVDLLPFERVERLFGREETATPAPVVARPAPLSPPTTTRPAPTPASPPRNWNEAAGKVLGKVFAVLFWGFMLWQYCAGQIVEVRTAPSPAPVVVDPPAPVPGIGASAPALVSPSPGPEFDVVCGIPLGAHVELARCGRPAADLLGFATAPPDGWCAEGTRARTVTDRYQICWIWIGHADVTKRPRATNPFASRP